MAYICSDFCAIFVLLVGLVLPGACASSTEQPGYITIGLAPVADFDALYATILCRQLFFFILGSFNRDNAPLLYLGVW